MEKRIKIFINNIEKQINRVKSDDAFLFFPPRVYEPAISHKLATYLQEIFPKYDIDVEYDKYGTDKRKELENFKYFCTDNSTDRIRPDIIVHNRGIQNGNILAVEIKDCQASQSSRNCVKEKLKKLTKRDGSFGYLLGVLWLFGSNKKEELFFYIDGMGYDSKLYKDMNEVLNKLKDYENNSQQTFNGFVKLFSEMKKNFREKMEKQEEEVDEYGKEEIENELVQQEYGEKIRALENIQIENENQEEERLSEMSPEDRYYETGIWGDLYRDDELSEDSGEDDESSESFKAEDTNEVSDEEIEYQAKQQQKQWKYERVQESILQYKQGILHNKDFNYHFLRKNVSEAGKLWLRVWDKLYFVSTNSLLFDHLYCIKKQKELLKIAFEYNDLLNIFDDDEKKLATEHLEFLTGWLGYQDEICKRKKKK